MHSTAGADPPRWGEPDDGTLAFLVTRPHLPAGFERWRVTLAPGARRHARTDDWEGALVLIDHGRLEVDCEAGGRHTFAAGDLLVLGRLPLHSLHNPGDEPVGLVAVRRRGEGPPAGLSRVIRHIRR